ncbi:MAG: hypothetical protein E7A62_02230 [Actinomycetaceae bacterium]|nr:hypothetical protein [Actinomycetaceae bacterium]MDU0969797.1 hypothetical protein [Actinomycetaceae bacterium]
MTSPVTASSPLTPRRVLAGCALVLALLATLLIGAPRALALPPGGAGDSNAGQSTINPSVLPVGGTVSFTLTGFPAGSTVSVKLDDGLIDGSDSSQQFTGVVHKGVVPASGTWSSSFVLPSYVHEGSHWLRFLTTYGPNNQGYTHRSANFQVVAAGDSRANSGGAVTGTTDPDNDANLAENQAGGATVTRSQAAPASSSAAPGQKAGSGTATASAPAQATASETPSATSQPSKSSAGGVPVVGIIVLVAVAVLVAAGLTAIVLRNRKLARAGTQAAEPAGDASEPAAGESTSDDSATTPPTAE